ncbi:MAG: TMEM175 family protein [Gemmatimonadaceae bacterium]
MSLGRKYLRGHEDGFEWRGREVSRLEGLSDAVFGFAITLLVVSLEVPQSVAELLHAMRGFFGFALSFALLFRLWGYQYRFFRRYGLEDPTTIRLNGVLLFVVLFFVYPLKFMTQLLTDFFMNGGLSTLRPGVLSKALVGGGYDLVLLFYGGFGTVFLVLGLMYLHAYRMRDHIGLNELEALDTRITCERLLLPLPVFPLAVGLMFAPSERVGGTATVGERPLYVALILVAEAGIFGYLGWALWRSRRLKKRRAALEQRMDEARVRGDIGHIVAPAVQGGGAGTEIAAL